MHTVSQRAWGLRLRGISARTRVSALAGVAFPLYPSAGINRHAVGNERVLQERNSEPPDLESCGGGREAGVGGSRAIGGVVQYCGN